MNCPFCGIVGPGISLNDGGSIVCETCGLWHKCANGVPRLGHAWCSLCKPSFGSDRRQVSAVFCDGCNADLSPIAGKRFKCKQCLNFDFCPACMISKQHNNHHTFYDPHSPTVPTGWPSPRPQPSRPPMIGDPPMPPPPMIGDPPAFPKLPPAPSWPPTFGNNQR
jgi:hypothetical protein